MRYNAKVSEKFIGSQKEIGELVGKIARVSKQIGSIGKESAEPGGQIRYKFQKWDSILPILRDACAEQGLWVIPSVASSAMSESTNKNGTVMSDWTVDLEFNIIDCKTGASIAVYWVGESADSGDKGAQKAATSGTKYFLLKTFMIPSADVEDNDSTIVEKGKPKEKSQEATALDIAMLKLGLKPADCKLKVEELMAKDNKLSKSTANKIVAEDVIREAGL